MKKNVTPILTIIIILFIVIMASGCTNTTTETKDSKISSDNPNPEAKNVVVISSNPHKDSIGNYIIDGEVRNKNDFGVAYVKVNATGYDDKGNIISQHTTYATPTDLDAGSKGEFTLYLEDKENNIARYDVQVLDADKSLYKYSSSESTSSNSPSNSASSSGMSKDSSAGVTATFVGSSNKDVYHYPSCYHVKQIKSSNLITFKSVQEAKNAGYRPCKDCNPPG